jgi:hypothetical protein
MAQTFKKKITTNSRVLSELLTKYKNTFHALCELITNSIQAQAKEIKLDIKYSDKILLEDSPIKSINLIDNGYGVAFSDFEKKILEVGTTVKADGQGIGRFAALQIGSKIEIDTVAFDETIQKSTRVVLPIDADEFKQQGLKDIDFDLTEEIYNDRKKSYYSVSIHNLYHGKQEKIAKRSRIVNELLPDKINLALFEKYPYQIFNNTVTFIVNGKKLERDDFIYDKPLIKRLVYENVKGEEVNINFYFYHIKLSPPKAKVFLQVENNGIKTVAHEYSYSSDWYSSDSGSWFIYVESPLFTLDLFRNIDFEDMGDEEFTKLKSFIKGVVNEFFVKINEKFQRFNSKLQSDVYNPHRDGKPASKIQESLFQKAAFLVESQYKLLEKDNKIRGLIYSLIDKALSDGNVQDIFDKILKLDQPTIEKFHDLLEKTELENVVQFASKVATHSEFLDFLHDLVYGEISKYIKERSQLHKIVEKQLWIFGEQYNGTPCLWSDRKIGGIFNDIRNQTMVYEPTEEDENLIKVESKDLNDITDLFFTNEKLTDDNCKEYMVVELKSPKCSIGQKEINQIDRYAFTIEKHDGLPSDKVKYKLILISSKLNDFTKSKLDSSFEKYRIPFMYETKTKKRIEIYIYSWSDLIESNRKKLSYLSQQLRVKDRDVKEKFEAEYSELMSSKFRSVLKRIS